MSKRTQQSRIAFIIEMIENIEFIVHRHDGIVNALEDIEGKMAILMGLTQMGETLNKLESETIELLEMTETQKGAYDIRNFIVHDYEGVDLYIVEEVIREYLPLIKLKLESKL